VSITKQKEVSHFGITDLSSTTRIAYKLKPDSALIVSFHHSIHSTLQSSNTTTCPIFNMQFLTLAMALSLSSAALGAAIEVEKSASFH
jgi:uncharacterized protein YaaN involved in tellurite resistance